MRKGSVALVCLVVLLTLSFVFFDLMYDKILEYSAGPASAAAADVWGIEEFDAPTGAKAILVQHHHAMERLNVTLPQECALPALFCRKVRLSPQLLPSWTLHRVQANCSVCTDTRDYTAATRGIAVEEPHAVFATSSAPLGRVGPMLFAMSSVTDDVSLEQELPQWRWMRHVYPRFAHHWENAVPAVKPYLAVMGVPSTDQPARVALRTAQRATWMTYEEVARAENNFDGALLPLYLFAAVEPINETEAAEEGDAAAAAAGTYTYVNASSVAPTVEEYERATQARLAVIENDESVHYTHRRVQLRENWNEASPATSPCNSIETHTVDESTTPSALTTLTNVLGLSTTPAFVSGAQFICHASAGLWQEALVHRNVVWIDMMTDRRPTTKKKLGEDGKWGLAVEVGMSQKLILWLEYAYHAFPDVPYIIKGDDDSYMKVPQYLSDLRHVMTDAMALPAKSTNAQSYLSLPLRTSLLSAAKGTQFTSDPLLNVSATPCVYWGSLRVHRGIRFAAGMTFMVHRNMARAVLSPSLRRRRVDVVRLATHTFHSKNTQAYRRSMFHREDILLGLLINASMTQTRQLCAAKKVFHMWEGYPRFHDLHTGKTHDVTWSTVVAHRCRPADYHFLHYFFQHEHRFPTAGLPRGVTAEAYALRDVKDWVAGQRQALPAEVVGWDALPKAVLTRRVAEKPSYTVGETDQVAVYDSTLRRFQDFSSRVVYGYFAEPLE